MIPPPPTAIANFLDALPPELQPLAYQTREFILQTLPQAEEQYKWKVPFYYVYGPLCYLSPGTDSLVIGFYRGAQMADPAGIFQAKDRKQIRHFPLIPQSPFPEEDLRLYLIEALMLNESAAT